MGIARAGRIAAAAAVGLAGFAVTATPPAAADDPPSMTITVDTTINTDTGIVAPGGQVVGTLQASPVPTMPQWRVITLSSLSINPGTTLTFTGTAIPVFDVTGSVAISGTLSVKATVAAPGPGGGGGGATGFNPSGGNSAGRGGSGIAGGGGGAFHMTGSSIMGENGQSLAPGSGGLGGNGACDIPGNVADGGNNGVATAPGGFCAVSSGVYRGGGGSGGGGRIFSGALVGGSGGGGGAGTTASPGAAGAHGGGAVRIEADGRIVVSAGGQITALGAQPATLSGGYGGGGAIWLRAPVVEIPGLVTALSGWSPSTDGAGSIQVDADCAHLNGTVTPTPTRNSLTGPSANGPCVPDLVVDAVNVPAGPVARGSTIEVSDTTTNTSATGNALAPASTTAYFLVDFQNVNDPGAPLLGTRSVPALAPGSSDSNSAVPVSVEIPADTLTGLYRVRACADHGNAVAEPFFEGNNCSSSATFQVVNAADLVVSALAEPPTSVERGGDILVSDTTANTGGVAAASSTTAYYLSSDNVAGGDELLASRDVPSLDAPAGLGDESSASSPTFVTVPAEITAGSYHLVACADADGEIDEHDETNNCRVSAEFVDVLDPLPNLAVTAVGAPPASVVQGKTIPVSFEVTNFGNGAAPVSVVDVFLDDEVGELGEIPIAAFESPALAAGQVAVGGDDVTVPVAVFPGTYDLVACVDFHDEIVEADEDNCRLATSQLTVVEARPDLVVTEVSDPPASRAQGASFKVNETVRNRGVARAAASENAYFLSADRAKGDDRKLTGARLVDPLRPTKTSTGTATVGIPLTTPTGRYFVLACADGRRTVTEAKEGNNCRASSTKLAVTRR